MAWVKPAKGRNITHQQKKLNEQELRHFRSRLRHSHSRRHDQRCALLSSGARERRDPIPHVTPSGFGWLLPARSVSVPIFRPPENRFTMNFSRGPADRAVATTMATVHLLSKLLADSTNRNLHRAYRAGPRPHLRYGSPVPQIWHLLTRGPALRACGTKTACSITRRPRTGRFSKRGSPRAGAISSFIAAGTCYSTSDINMIPFFFFYSMFGFQRIGDPDLGGRRCPGPGLSARRYGRADHPGR